MPGYHFFLTVVPLLTFGIFIFLSIFFFTFLFFLMNLLFFGEAMLHGCKIK